ncbi:MAG: hypothetical protein JXA96_00890 [Sedimentisphaerales bacterium]|nr:hypothetical protein [Sedimentisphaerales bacterium]
MKKILNFLKKWVIEPITGHIKSVIGASVFGILVFFCKDWLKADHTLPSLTLTGWLWIAIVLILILVIVAASAGWKRFKRTTKHQSYLLSDVDDVLPILGKWIVRKYNINRMKGSRIDTIRYDDIDNACQFVPGTAAEYMEVVCDAICKDTSGNKILNIEVLMGPKTVTLKFPSIKTW